MKQRFGITEETWDTLAEDKKLVWRVSLLIGSIAIALMVCRTGFAILDGALVCTTVLLGQVVVESQRALRKIQSPHMRKTLLRLLIAIGTYTVTLLATIFLLSMAYAMTKAALPAFVTMADAGLPQIHGAVALVLTCMAFGHAFFQSYKRLQLHELVFALPRSALQRIFLGRAYVARSFLELGAFELLTHFVIFYYMFTAIVLVQILVG